MKLETLLPLGKVDPGLRAPEVPLDLGSIAANVQLLEGAGYAGFVTEETKDDPFVVMALAGQATETLHLTTGVAIAPPRSPTVMAQSAWTIQKMSGGRFTLGWAPRCAAISPAVMGWAGTRPGLGCGIMSAPSVRCGIVDRMAPG